jgi:hypothetical protein
MESDSMEPDSTYVFNRVGLDRTFRIRFDAQKVRSEGKVELQGSASFLIVKGKFAGPLTALIAYGQNSNRVWQLS